MKAEKDKVVLVSYELTVEGKVIDTATRENPLDYIQGGHMLLPGFEAAVEGKEPGEKFSCTLPPEEGYGVYDPARIITLPLASFEIDGKVREDLLEAGRMLPMYNSNGYVEHARIKEIKSDGVVMDFNHELAGKVLNFNGEVVSVRDATEKELKQGLHGEYLPMEDCDCGCGHKHGEGECCHGHGDDECCHGHGDGECCHHHE